MSQPAAEGRTLTGVYDVAAGIAWRMRLVDAVPFENTVKPTAEQSRNWQQRGANLASGLALQHSFR
jgi:hypothetical protein